MLADGCGVAVVGLWGWGPFMQLSLLLALSNPRQLHHKPSQGSESPSSTRDEQMFTVCEYVIELSPSLVPAEPDLCSQVAAINSKQ